MCTYLLLNVMQAALATGKEGSDLVPDTQEMVKVIAAYKLAATAVKNLVPKAKAKAKAKAAA